MIAYYSQHGEDCLLAEFFGFKTSGYFVDVGAYDGIYLSNSYTFERLGWQGLCIEPSPHYAALCRQNRPRSVCHQVACQTTDGQAVSFREETGGLFSGIATDEGYAAYCYSANQTPFAGFQTVSVPSATLNSLLNNYRGPIDFVSIDVEGAELDVLKGFDLRRFKPRVLVIEANNPQAAQALDGYLAERGFGLARVIDMNRFYVGSQQDWSTLREITVATRLEIPPHPSGSSYRHFGYPESAFVYWPGDSAASVPTGFYNHVTRRAALLHLRNVGLVIDIGANVGQFALSLRRDYGYRGRIVSFEPLRDAFQKLQAHAAADPLWDCHNTALGDFDGNATINVSANSQSSSFLPVDPYSLVLEPSIGYIGKEEVPVRRLDSLFGQIVLPGDVVCMKVDAQGYEMKILDGASGILDRLDLIQLEASFLPVYQGEKLAGDLINRLDSLGFRVVGAEPAWVDQKTGELLQADLIFARKVRA